jgi:hypothetical protein
MIMFIKLSFQYKGLRQPNTRILLSTAVIQLAQIVLLFYYIIFILNYNSTSLSNFPLYITDFILQSISNFIQAISYIP